MAAGSLKPEKNNSFCSFPWTGAQVHVSGQVRPCCMMDDMGLQYRQGTAVQDVLNSPEMISVKESLLRGEKPYSCRACYEEDNLGITSVRFYSPPLPEATKARDTAPLHRAEISFTNACNLDCVMCRPEFSLKVWKTQKEFNDGRDTPYLLRDVKPFSISEDDVESLIGQFQDAKECRLIGGEPLMSKAARKFIKLWGERKLPGKLDIVTNGTFLDNEILADVARCPKAILNVSVDGHGAVYEWIRGHAWKDISEKLIRASALVPMKVTPTVQVYNLLNLPELSEFCAAHNIRLRLGHILRHPHHLSALLWPLHVRRRCAENFRSLWGEDHADLLHFLKQEASFRPALHRDLREWTSFMNRKRGFAWEAAEPRAHWYNAVEEARV